MALTNSQYDTIIREYDRRRMRNERENNDRIAYINEHLPEYARLGDMIASLSAEHIKKVLAGEVSSSSEISARIDELSDKRKNVLKEAGYPEDYLEVKYDCPDCRDTGYIDGRKCHCLRQNIINVLYSQSNISELLKEDNFSSLSYDHYEGEDLTRFKAAVSAAHSFIDHFDKDYQNLLFCGTVGTGKSFLSCCIARELLDRGYCVIYFSAVKLFETLSDVMFNHGDTDELRAALSDIYECDLLIIDDLGTELTNSAVATQLFSLLNERHLSSRPTVISTNLTLEDIRERYEDRIFSRIAERYDIYRISGPDIRRIKKTGQLRNRKE